MSTTGENSTEDLLRELLATVNILKKDVDDLKVAKDEGRPNPWKRQRNGDSEGSHDGDWVIIVIAMSTRKRIMVLMPPSFPCQRQPMPFWSPPLTPS